MMFIVEKEHLLAATINSAVSLTAVGTSGRNRGQVAPSAQMSMSAGRWHAVAGGVSECDEHTSSVSGLWRQI